MTRSKRRLTLLAALCGGMLVVAGGSYGGLKWYRSRQVQDARAVGYAKFAAGDFEAALAPLSLYVGKNPTDIDALLKLAECRRMVPSDGSRNLRDAAGLFKAVLKTEPQNQLALVGLVEVYSQLRDRFGLKLASDDLLAIEPDNVKALEARMLLAGAEGDWKRAGDSCARLIELEPLVYNWRRLALDIQRSNKADVAARIATVNGWIEKGEPDGRYRLLLALLVVSDEQRDPAARLATAEREALKAASMGMPDSDVLSSLVDLADLLDLECVRLGGRECPEIADKAIATAMASGLDPAGVASMQIRRRWLAGRIDDAKQQLSLFNANDAAAKRELLRWTIVLAEGGGDTAASNAAIGELRALVKGDHATEDQIVAWIDAVEASRIANISSGGVPTAPKLAMAAFARAGQHTAMDRSARGSFDAFLSLRAGDVALRMGDPDEALRMYRDAYDIERGRWLQAGVQTASALLTVGQTDEAYLFARQLLVRFPNVSVGLVLAQTCDAIRREGRSLTSVDPTLPANFTASTFLSDLYESLGSPTSLLPSLIATKVSEGRDEEAKRLAAKAVAATDTSSQTLLQIVGLLGNRRFGTIANEALEKARAKTGVDPTDITVATARLLIERGDFAAARSVARDALAENANPAAQARLAQVQAEAAVAAADDDAVAMLAECLRAGSGSMDCVSFVLGQPATWNDRALVDAALKSLKDLSGERSSRAILTEASAVLRFDRLDASKVGTAAAAVDDLLRTNPGSTAAMVTLARLLASTQPPDFAGAAKQMRTAVDLQPGRRDLYPELITLLQSSGDFTSASRYLQQYMRSAEGDTDQSRLAAGLLVSSGDFLTAIPTLERVASSSRTEADLVTLADVRRRAGQPAKAEEAFKEAISRPDRSILSTMAYAEFLARDGRLAAARALITEDAAREKPALVPSNRAYLLAKLELDYGDPKSAGPAVAEAIALAPDSPGVALLAARFKLAQGDVPAAIAAAQAGLAKTPKDPQLLGFVSSLLMADSSSREISDASLSALRAENPALADLLSIVRASAGADGMLAPDDSQLKALVALTERYPNSVQVWVSACELHAAAGKIPEAVQLARRGMARLPTEPQPAELAARLLLTQRRLDESREAARTWRSLTADSPLDADLFLARLALLAGKPNEASTILQPYFVRLQSDVAAHPDGLGTYATVLLLQGQAESAFNAVRSQLSDPGLRVEWLRGVRLAASPVALDALARTAAVIGVDDNGRLALITEYAALARRRDAGDAQSKAKALLASLSPATRNAPITQLLTADLAAASGDAMAASALYEGVWSGLPAADRDRLLVCNTLDAKSKAELAPAMSFAIYASNNAASALAEAGVNLDQAMVAIDRALVMQSEDVGLLETKATVFLARKELDAARALLAPLAARPDASASVYLTLARVELAAGNIDDARRAVRSAERLLAEDPLSERTLLDRLADVKKQVDAAAAKPKV